MDLLSAYNAVCDDNAALRTLAQRLRDALEQVEKDGYNNACPATWEQVGNILASSDVQELGQ